MKNLFGMLVMGIALSTFGCAADGTDEQGSKKTTTALEGSRGSEDTGATREGGDTGVARPNGDTGAARENADTGERRPEGDTGQRRPEGDTPGADEGREDPSREPNGREG